MNPSLHISRKRCMASGPITAAAVTAGGALHTGSRSSIDSDRAAAIGFRSGGRFLGKRCNLRRSSSTDPTNSKHTMASQEPTIAATVQAQFTPAHNAQRACRHCEAVPSPQSLSSMKGHLAACKSLPDSVRAVLDHAAVCESRAGLGRYGGAHASVYRGFRVTGWGVNECRGCGKVVRGWQRELSRHIKRQRCMASDPITATATAAVTAGGALHTRSIESGGAATVDCTSTMSGCSTRATKRQRPVDIGTSNACDDHGDDVTVHANWLHHPTMPRCGGSGGGSNNREVQLAQQQATR